MTKLNMFRRMQIIHLLLGMMFFYGIEQLFFNHIIKDNSVRGYSTIGYTLSIIVFSIPTGILADKVSRKLSLALACCVLAVSMIVCGISTAPAIYILGSVLYGLYASLYDGAAQALLYDDLASRGEEKQYARKQGSCYAWFLIGACLANVSSGFLANALGLRAPFFLSIVPAALTLLITLGISEIRVGNKTEGNWVRHLGTVIREVHRHVRILVFGLQFIIAEIIFTTIGEYGQIYILGFHVSTVGLGIIWALVALAAATGRGLAHRVQTIPRTMIAIYCASLIALAFVHTAVLGIILFCLMYGLTELVANITETEVQNEASSDVRATTFSVISMFAYILAIPIIYWFTQVYTHHGVAAANKPVALLATGVLLLTLTVQSRKPISSVDPSGQQLPVRSV